MHLLPKDRDLTEPPEEIELLVHASDFRLKVSELSLRLDHFLSEHINWRSRSSIQRLVKDGYVHVDASTPDHPQGTGQAVPERRPGRKLRHGSRVLVVIPEENRRHFSADAMGPLDILFEDREVVVVDKPSGVAVHPSGRHFSDTLIQRVHAHYKEQVEASVVMPRLCHRLDRETSGLVLISKNPATHGQVMAQFEGREVQKTYMAITWGVPDPRAGSLRLPLGSSRASEIRLKMAVRADGLEARTDYEVIEEIQGARGSYALVRCMLHTGRQHQVRVHLEAMGHPVVGDKLYGPDDRYFTMALAGVLDARARAELELERHALHNHRIRFRSPDGDRRVEVTSPLHGDLRAFLDTT